MQLIKILHFANLEAPFRVNITVVGGLDVFNPRTAAKEGK